MIFYIKNYIKNDMSLTKLANECSCSRSAVKFRLIKFGIIEDDRRIYKCSHCGKETKSGGLFKDKEYCKKHHNHMYRHGKILERTIYDKNKFIELEDCYKVILYDKDGNRNGQSFFSKKDYELVSKYKWYLSHGYAKTKGISAKGHKMHEVLITDVKEGYFTDHIDRDKLNNRRSNLRTATHQQNAMNMSMKSSNSSGVTGVQAYKNDSKDKWDASITYNYETIHLMRSLCFDDCVKARLKAEAEYFSRYSANYKKDLDILSIEYVSHDDDKKTILKVGLDGSIIEFSKFNNI